MEQYSICRICGDYPLISILNLGESPISGQFPFPNEAVSTVPLNLARCASCGLIQLLHRIPITDLYTTSYGYESHLNSSMVFHLKSKARRLQELYLKSDSGKKIIVDIASNDGIFLSGFQNSKNLIQSYGIDPLIENFDDFYPKNSIKVEEFFTKQSYLTRAQKLADLVTSMSVFYDLNNPVQFASEVWSILEVDGIWHLEQSYCPSMVESMSFDTIVHEHLLYLRAHDFERIFNEVGFSVIEVENNTINGGSLAITAQKTKKIAHCKKFHELLRYELDSGYCELDVFTNFAKKVNVYGSEFPKLINDLKLQGNQIFGLGASTKGNIILNYCKLDNSIITAIGEVNPKKIGRVTPGTNIPIINESDILSIIEQKVIAIILPWHFKETFMLKTENFRRNKNRVIFPLPEIFIT